MGSSATRIVCPSTLPVQTKGKWEGDGGGGSGWLWSCWPFNLFVCSSCTTSEGFETARVCVFCRWVASTSNTKRPSDLKVNRRRCEPKQYTLQYLFTQWEKAWEGKGDLICSVSVDSLFLLPLFIKVSCVCVYCQSVSQCVLQLKAVWRIRRRKS